MSERHDPPRHGHSIVSVRFHPGMQHRYECKCGVPLGMTLRESKDMQRFHRIDLHATAQAALFDARILVRIEAHPALIRQRPPHTEEMADE